MCPPEKQPPYVKLLPNQTNIVHYEAPSSQIWFHKRFVIDRDRFVFAAKPIPTKSADQKVEPCSSSSELQQPNIDPCTYFVQEPGDIVFIPAGWWHCAMNLDYATLACTQNLLTRKNVQRMVAQIRSEAPAFAAKLAEEFRHCHE